jgi:hypothetical protein
MDAPGCSAAKYNLPEGKEVPYHAHSSAEGVAFSYAEWSRYATWWCLRFKRRFLRIHDAMLERSVDAISDDDRIIHPGLNPLLLEETSQCFYNYPAAVK